MLSKGFLKGCGRIKKSPSTKALGWLRFPDVALKINSDLHVLSKLETSFIPVLLLINKCKVVELARCTSELQQRPHCLKTFHFIFQQGEVLSENRKDTHDPTLSPRDISACITDIFDVYLFLHFVFSKEAIKIKTQIFNQ